ncbi:MAG: hypothetical protein LBQ49_01930 [Rickettsiales bacterium]|jgi:hypothetical protein|nr:hypothetical protein [Rickettsiales bacterium]
MQYKKNQMSMGLMVQRCHRWRQKRKQYIDQARATPDEIERERLLQMAEHYGRVVSDEQSRIDTRRDPGGRDFGPRDLNSNGNGSQDMPPQDLDDEDYQDFKSE